MNKSKSTSNENNSNRSAEREATSTVNVSSDMETKNTDENLVPEWVNSDLFKDVLSENIENFQKITQFKAMPAVSPGENYMTLILRISIEVELKDKSNKNVSFVMKISQDNVGMAKEASSLEIFEKELAMYFDVIPKLEKLYRDKGYNVCIAPKVYKFKKDPEHENILLEDLRVRGFKNANRLVGLDMEHTLAVLKKLALLHAATAHWVATSGTFAQCIMKSRFNEGHNAFYEKMISSLKTGFLNGLQYYENGEKYRDVVQKAFTNFELKSFIKLSELDPNDFNVVNHGDCWSNNILFSHNGDGEILDTLFVDFQLSNFGSPTRDLYYFILSSVNKDIKLKYFDYFIRFYHDNLVENLKNVSYPKKIPTLRELHIKMIEKGFLALSSAAFVMPVVLLDSTEHADLENLTSSSEGGKSLKNSLYTNKRYCECIAELLPWLYNRGVLESFVLPENAAGEMTSQVKDTTTEKKLEETKGQSIDLIPAWVKEDHFEGILRTTIKGFDAIKKFSVAPATTTGENYASVLLKIDVESRVTNGHNVSSSFMLKICHSSGFGKNITDLFGIFKKEAFMYHEIIPKYEQFYKSAGIDVIFAPRCFKFVKEPDCETILLENLRVSGFKNADRLVGLDIEHTKCVLAKLAQLHAASAFYFDEIGPFPEMYVTGVHVEENRAMMEALIDQFYPVFVDCAKTYAKSEEYIKKLQNCKPKLFDTMMFLNKVQPNSFNVLNHGDCWTNNIMFQYNPDGSIQNTYFIDFQMPKYGSPAQDLYYFLFSSPQLDIKLEQFDYCIRFYYENLKSNLELLNYTKKVPTLRELHCELLTYGVWGLVTIQGAMSAVLLEPSKDANLEFMVSEGDASKNFQANLFKASRYRSHAEPLLIWLNRRGLLDIV